MQDANAKAVFRHAAYLISSRADFEKAQKQGPPLVVYGAASECEHILKNSKRSADAAALVNGVKFLLALL